MHNVFVYGSLKNGYGNNRLLQSSEYCGQDITSSADFKMISLCSFPGVIHSENGFHISGELYRVNDKTLQSLDRLEGNGSFYKRELVKLKGFDEDAWMYVLMDGRGFNHEDDRVQSDENLNIHKWVQKTKFPRDIINTKTFIKD